jgi:CheY-like chemotaxis protein
MKSDLHHRPEAGADIDERAPIRSPQPGSCRVMILEDEPLVALELQMIIEEMGLTVSAVLDNEADALDEAKNNPPDLIIADIQLRRGNGLSAAEAIAQGKGSGERRLPVIVVSGNQNMVRPDQFDRVRFLAKPFNDEALRRAVAEAMAEDG